MPCSDSSSGLNFRLDSQERFLGFEFAKITCSSEIGAQTGLSAFLSNKSLLEILDFDFNMLVSILDLNEDQERQFIMYLELAALKAAVAQYLGKEDKIYDADRCKITSIEHSPEGIEVALVILPPAELPKIVSCSSAKSIPSL